MTDPVPGPKAAPVTATASVQDIILSFTDNLDLQIIKLASFRESKLAADNRCIIAIKIIITDGSPSLIVADFHTPFSAIAASNQS